jgi:hypothetical protein
MSEQDASQQGLVKALNEVANLGFVIRMLADRVEELTRALNEDIALRKANPPR